MAAAYIEEDEEKQRQILLKKKRELADLDADLDEFMHAATDGNFNLKVLNDAFEGRAHENEEIDLIDLGDGERKIKKRQKRPPRPDATTKPTKTYDDPRVAAVMEDVMRRS